VSSVNACRLSIRVCVRDAGAISRTAGITLQRRTLSNALSKAPAIIAGGLPVLLGPDECPALSAEIVDEDREVLEVAGKGTQRVADVVLVEVCVHLRRGDVHRVSAALANRVLVAVEGDGDGLRQLRIAHDAAQGDVHAMGHGDGVLLLERLARSPAGEAALKRSRGLSRAVHA